MDVTAIAKLANLSLTDSEKNSLSTQFADTLETINIINELDTSHVSPSGQVTGLTNITRADGVDKSRLLPPPPDKYFIVPAIFQNES